MSGLQHVKDLKWLEKGETYELHVMKAGTYEGKGRTRLAGRVEWVRTEPHHPEWGHIKLYDRETLIRIDVDEWLEARKITPMNEMDTGTTNIYDRKNGEGGRQPGVTTADLSEQLQKEERRARQIKKQNGEGNQDTEENYWEGYVVGLRKAQELVKEYEIVKKWVG